MHRFIVSASLLAITAISFPATAQHGRGSMSQASAAANAPMAEAVVRKIDRKTGEITLSHGPLANLGMPKMTMTYRVKDRALLNSVKEGSNIRFAAEEVKGEVVVVSLEAMR